jgi:hypothetical protein
MAEVENFICPECNKKWSYVKISPGIMKETISIELGGEKELCPDCMQKIISNQREEIECYEDNYE